MNQLLTTKPLTMTSLDLAKLVEKRHDNVMEDVRKLQAFYEETYSPEKSGELIKTSTYKDSTGRTLPCFELSKDACLDLVTGYSLPHRHAVNQRWMELEQGEVPNFGALEPLGKGFAALVAALKSFGLDDNAAAIGANNAIVRLSGLNILTLTDNTHLLAEKQEQVFTPTQLGALCNPRMSAQLMNLSLQNAGLQHRVGNSWVVTEDGKPFARFYDTGKRHGDGTPVIQTKWLKSVLDELDKEDDI